MNYHEIMEAFSCCGLGAILAAKNQTILDINQAGERLLRCRERPLGKPLELVAPFLAGSREEQFGNPSFDQYLLPCPSPKIAGLPPYTRLLVFRDATKDFYYEILENVFNHINEAIAVWDGESRIIMLNNAAEKMEAQVFNDIMGKHISTLYRAGKDSVLAIPMVIDSKQPVRNLRQNYLTHFGKELQIVSNSYPVLKNGRVLAAACMMENWSKTEELNKRVLELQRLLVGSSKSNRVKSGGALMAKYTFDDIIHHGPAIRLAVERCKLVSDSDSSVLLYGETGTGKELFAQSIHNESRRADKPFIAINCAAIPEALLESMLFGTEKGAYTGAEKREGIFEQANKGTLLLDEINSMGLNLQSKFLRVLQDGLVRRVGGMVNIHVDVRIISSMNISPAKALEDHVLRQDLFHRLGVVAIRIPPLRERDKDLPLLIRSFITSFNKKLLKNIRGLHKGAQEIFSSYEWPGNVRELEHALEHAINIAPQNLALITPEYIPDHILAAVDGDAHRADCGIEALTMEDVMFEAGKKYLRKALRDNDWNITRTATIMGISRQTLQHRLRRFEIKIAENEVATRIKH